MPGARGTKLAIATFVASSGGVGNATLASETAVLLKAGKETRNLRICLFDLDFQTSHVCDYLDIDARLQMQEIVKQHLSSFPLRWMPRMIAALQQARYLGREESWAPDDLGIMRSAAMLSGRCRELRDRLVRLSAELSSAFERGREEERKALREIVIVLLAALDAREKAE
jgi:cellulose biosynthesis protein BcsQ